MSTLENMLTFLRAMPEQPPAIDISEYSKPSHVAGRVVVITGGNAGLGYATAEHFARLKPARLIISSRSQEKGDKAAAGVCFCSLFEIRLLKPFQSSNALLDSMPLRFDS